MTTTTTNSVSSGGGARPGGERVTETISGPRTGTRELWVEVPRADGHPAAWCYSDQRSYRAGQSAGLRVSSTVDVIVIRIYRDSVHRPLVFTSGPLTAKFHPAPHRAFEVGCDWPVLLTWDIPQDLASGGYLVEISAATGPSHTVLGHDLLIVRACQKALGTMALVAATSTWTAYNEWGGANHYHGINEGTPRGRSPYLAKKRPWARGQIWLPDGAPRSVNSTRPNRPGPARYDSIEWAYVNGYTRYCSVSGWATYERPFLVWAESNGYTFDVLTQDELHSVGENLLSDYDCVVFVGHDEYWSREMRQAVDAYIDSGGHVARFAGNLLWQIRMEDDNQRQVAFKYGARNSDPVLGTPAEKTLTSAWEDPLVNYPGAVTFGVNGLRGIYASFGGMARRAARGFTVFRPQHWSFDGTGLGYADMFGDEANIFGFEMDGLDYTFRDGLPVPTHEDGAPDGTEILAMGWATLIESGLPQYDDSLALGDGDARFRATLLGNSMSQEAIDKHSRGSGMVVNFKRGQGEVYTAGTCEWVNGLIERDFYTEQITRNVLERFNRQNTLVHSNEAPL